MMRSMTLVTTALALALASGAPAQAQTAGDGPRGQISFSPILALAEIVNGEAEYAFSQEMGAVFGLGYFTLGDGADELTYLATDLKLRFYPDATPMDGFSISGILGRTSVTESQSDESVAGMTLGVELGRSWLFGDEGRWYFGIGIGAKRFFGDESVGSTDVTAFLPTGRLNFGITF